MFFLLHVQWTTETGNDTHDVYKLEKPIAAINARLTTKPCETQCAASHEFITSDGENSSSDQDNQFVLLWILCFALHDSIFKTIRFHKNK